MILTKAFCHFDLWVHYAFSPDKVKELCLKNPNRSVYNLIVFLDGILKEPTVLNRLFRDGVGIRVTSLVRERDVRRKA